MARESGGIQSIERAVAILDIVADHPEGISLAQLSSQLGLNNTTAFHLLKTLLKLGIVAQDTRTKHYHVGSRLFMLAAGALNETTLLALATPVLERLSRDSGEVAHLAVRSHHEIVVIARTAATGLLQLSGRTGATRPAHATAIGKVLLAEMPPADLEHLLDTLPLPALTAKTITDRDGLLRELDQVRKQQVAYDNGELDQDVKCVAMPVYDFAGRCSAALGISGPVWRMNARLLPKKTQQLHSAAAELSAQLGFNDRRSV
jgi:IclR family acetate operon transcriptional repressor